MPFVTIPNSVFEAGKPIRAIDMRALRDNLLAVAEGQPNAPKINQGALERLTPGSEIRSRIDAEATTVSSGSSIAVRHSFTFMQIGEIRVAFEHRTAAVNAAIRAFVRRVRDGVTTELASFNSATAYAARIVDVSVLPGDTLEICWVSTSNISSFIRNARFQTNGENLWTATSQILEGNTYA